MTYQTGLIITLLTIIAVSPDCNSNEHRKEAVHLPFSLNYGKHFGLDCYQMGYCGFRVEVTSTGKRTLFEDRGQWQRTAVDTLSKAQADSLVNLFQIANFQNYPPQLPSTQRIAGSTTVTISITDTLDGTTKQVQASLEDTSQPFPEGFLLFEHRLQKLLLAMEKTKANQEDETIEN